MLTQLREEKVWDDWEVERVPPVFERRTPPAAYRPSFNLALLYLLVLIGTGVWISRNRLWEGKLVSPMESLSIGESEPAFQLPALRVGRSNRVIHYVRSGERLATLFSRFGLKSEEAPMVEQAIRAINPKEPLLPRAGRKITMRLSAKGEFSRLTYPISQDREVFVGAKIEAGKRLFHAKIVSTPPLELQVVARAEVRTSFAAAAKQANVPYEITDDAADLFGDRIDFRKSFRPGDRFTLIYRQQMLKGAPAGKAGPIIAAVFNVRGKDFYALRYVGSDGKARYFDETGKMLGESFLRFPLQFSKITSVFSDARFHPLLRVKRPHNGVDFAAPIGTTVRTIGDGQVVFAGYNGPNGNMVRIRHNDRLTTEYLHLSRITPGLRRGTFIGKGEVIGAVGTTGLSTGPHLHFGMYDRGKYVDPLHRGLPLLENLGRGKAIDRKYLSGLLLTLHRHQTEDLDGPSVRTVSVITEKHKS